MSVAQDGAQESATSHGPEAERVNPSERRPTTILAGAAAVVLAAGGLVAALGLGAGAQLASSPEAAATTVRATAPSLRPQYTAQAPMTPGVVRCAPSVLNSACGASQNPAGQAGSSGTGASGAAEWFNSAKAPFADIQDALQTAGKEAQASNVDGVRNACEQLRTGSQRLEKTLPSPDKGVTSEVQSAVDELTVAAEMCLAPNATSNYQAVMSHVTAANSHFSAAQAIIESKS